MPDKFMRKLEFSLESLFCGICGTPTWCISFQAERKFERTASRQIVNGRLAVGLILPTLCIAIWVIQERPAGPKERNPLEASHRKR